MIRFIVVCLLIFESITWFKQINNLCQVSEEQRNRKLKKNRKKVFCFVVEVINSEK